MRQGCQDGRKKKESVHGRSDGNIVLAEPFARQLGSPDAVWHFVDHESLNYLVALSGEGRMDRGIKGERLERTYKNSFPLKQIERALSLITPGPNGLGETQHKWFDASGKVGGGAPRSIDHVERLAVGGVKKFERRREGHWRLANQLAPWVPSFRGGERREIRGDAAGGNTGDDGTTQTYCRIEN